VRLSVFLCFCLSLSVCFLSVG